jgi:hypothetical protein
MAVAVGCGLNDSDVLRPNCRALFGNSIIRLPSVRGDPRYRCAPKPSDTRHRTPTKNLSSSAKLVLFRETTAFYAKNVSSSEDYAVFSIGGHPA